MRCKGLSMVGEPARNKDRKSLIDNLTKAGKKTRFKKGQKLSEKTKEKMKGRIPWNKGTIGVMKKGKTSFKKGSVPWNKGLGNDNEVKRIRRSLEFKEWKKEILKERNYTCERCGVRGQKLHIHHLEMVCVAPEKIMEKDNVIVVCIKCHKKIHKEEMPVNQYLIKKYRGVKTLGYSTMTNK
jgi:DNA-directed RNA polymerase subunit RPC12/RpoP